MADEELDEGLICHSYDSLWKIRKRLRKINDLQIPIRRGITTTQLGIAAITFLAAVISYGLIVLPVLRLFGGSNTVWLLLLWLLVPPILVAQRLTKPMAYGKSIGTTVNSLLRYHLDDRVHRRGLPVPPARQPSDIAVLHYQREWVMAKPYVSDDDSAQADITDRATERRFTGDVIELGPWATAKALEHLAQESAATVDEDRVDDEDAHYRRGGIPTVHLPETEDEGVA